MFQRLLKLKLSHSPTLIYIGFSKLWLTTNISSLAMLSCNGFGLALLNYKPHPFQLVLSVLITAPGVLGILSPSYHLYRLLIECKESRTEEVLSAGHTLYENLSPEKRAVAYSNLYSVLFVERNIGNLQVAFSFSIALVSFAIGLAQFFGIAVILR